MEKICSKCEISKSINEYYKKYARCKSCVKEDRKQYNIKNQEKLKNYRQKKKEEYKEILQSNEKKICEECKVEKNVSEFSIRRIVCKECAKKVRKEYEDKNREKINERTRKYRENNPKIKQYDRDYAKKWNKENKEKLKIREKKRKESDVSYKLKHNLSRLISKKIKKDKGTHTIKLLGCNINFFKKWIEYQFDDKMNWDNYSTYWQLDHVKPRASYDFKKQEEIEECFNWKNVRPLEKKENNSKKDKIIIELIEKHKEVVHEFLKNSDASIVNTTMQDTL